MGIFDVLTKAANIAKESGKLELQGEILSVYEKLLEQQKKISDLEQENKELKEEIYKKENITPRDGVYYQILQSGKEDGPFCTLCYDDGGKLIRMDIGSFPIGVMPHPTYYSKRCPKCHKHVK